MIEVGDHVVIARDERRRVWSVSYIYKEYLALLHSVKYGATYETLSRLRKLTITEMMQYKLTGELS